MLGDLFDFSRTRAVHLFREASFPWEVLDELGPYICRTGPDLPEDFEEISEDVWVGRGSVISVSARIQAPAVIGRNVEVRQGAFLRGNVMVGDGAVLGNSVELRNCILFDETVVPHFNCVGDSILGWGVILGAGTVFPNLRLDRAAVRVRLPDGTRIDTGRSRLGSFIGDGSAIGSNAVVNPGSVVGRNARIEPLTQVKGFVPPGSLLRQDGSVILKGKEAP